MTTTKDILVITPTVTHPQNAGNRVRIFRMLKELQHMGHRIHLVYDGSERAAGHVQHRQDLGAMRRQWDSFYYVPNQAATYFQHLNEKNRSWFAHMFFMIVCHVGEVLTPGRLTFQWVDRQTGRIGRFIHLLSPRLYYLLKPRVPDDSFLISLEHLAAPYQPPQYDIDKRYPSHLDTFLQKLTTQKKFEVVLVEYVFMSKALELFDDDVYKVIDTHDVFSNRDALFKKYNLRDPMFTTSPEQEMKGLSRADVVIAIQSSERDYFATLVGGPVVTIGHSAKIVQGKSKPSEQFTFAFIGARNSANQEAAERIIKDVLPKVREKIPHAQLVIAGSVCADVPQTPGCRVLGEVADVGEVYEQTTVVLNPVRTGTGLKIKCIEALGYGKPLIVSTHAAIGLEGAEQAMWSTDTLDDIAQALVTLAQQPERCTNMSNTALSFAQSYNQKIQKSLDEVFSQTSSTPSEPHPERFTLFTWPRTGASSLSTILKQHPEVKLLEEPFHRTKGMALPPDDIGALRSALYEMWQTHNGLKHNWGLSGVQTSELLLHPRNQIIFLWRKNALQREVSLCISQQSDYWESNADGRDTLLEKTFAPIDIPAARTRITKYLAEVDSCRDQLAQSGKPFFEITYEELYDPEKPLIEKVDQINCMLAFVGKSAFTSKQHLQTLQDHLDPSQAKLNSKETYRKIPNIYDVEAQLGSDHVGWLFR